jgi:hypothetical protein
MLKFLMCAASISILDSLPRLIRSLADRPDRLGTLPGLRRPFWRFDGCRAQQDNRKKPEEKEIWRDRGVRVTADSSGFRERVA